MFNVDSTKNSARNITHSADISIDYQGHHEKVTAEIMDLGKNQVILGYMWLKKYNLDIVTIAHFFSSSLYSYASLFISLLVECSIPIINISFTPFHPNIFGSNHSSLEYSPQNIPLYYLNFYHLLSYSISFVIPLMINIYKPHNSFQSFPMLVYLVPLAPINSLVTFLDLDKSPPHF